MSSQNLAFEVTQEDVMLALELDDVSCFFDNLDFNEITAAALSGDDMDEQMNYALEEIKRQYEELTKDSQPEPNTGEPK